MEEKNQPNQNEKSESRLNQGMIIALIGAFATIVAALIPVISNLNKPEPSPTSTSIPPTEASTFTPSLPTIEFTPTLEELTPTVTATPTPIMGFYDVYLAIDPTGEVPSDTFPSDQPVYVFFKINDPTDQGKIKVIWYAVEVDGVDPNAIVYRLEDTILKSKGSVQGGGNGIWKPGKYKVELYLNGQLSSTREFEITQ
ncbi:MAG: hypothetical protein HZB19_15925 [Chloroflexi bacterium]|nr:hypothetical protein [Chloroflexota bacterium]